MKVVVASTVVPFVKGGATQIVDWLAAMLERAGHRVEIFPIPFHSAYPEMLDQMLALRLMDIGTHADRLIAVRTPSYLLRHPAKVLWFIHHHRGAYDLWGTRYQDIPNTPDGLRFREALINADNAAFSEARRIFANSRVVADRLRTFNGVGAEVLYPPLLDPGRYRTGAYGDYLLYVSRLVAHKRQELAIHAMRQTRTPVKLVLAGQADEPGYEDRLRRLVETHHLSGRVSLLAGWIPEARKIELFADCLASVYIPFDEDSYGYSSLEAHHAGKAVLTASDSGGPLELVVDGENGLVAEPEPAALAAAMDRLWLDRRLAREMGEAGRRRIPALGIAWERVLDRLLA
jgi:glycosyltransferase involved in cell wall biosynthesis